MGEYVQKLNLSDNLQSVLAVPAYLIGVPLVECPLIFHHMVLAGYLFSCWRLKENGGKMADVFVRRFTELGGKLILNDGAKKIFLKSGKAAGLQLESGCSLPADAIVAAIHPKTLLPLLPPEALKKSYRQRIMGMEETEGVIVVQVSVDAGTHQEMPYNIYRLHPEGKGILKNGIFCQLRRSNAPEKNLLTIITKSLYDDWSKWKNTKPGERGLEYEEKKLRIAQDLLQASDKILGKLTTPHIIDVFTPLTLRDYVNCADGSCYGVMHSSSQLLKIASLNNVPLPGLYLAGQNVVAPGVLGTTLGSFNAASKIAGAEQLAKILQ
jgi:phytoene dehydrogenase-like protein